MTILNFECFAINESCLQSNISPPSLDIIDILGYNYHPYLNKALLNDQPAKINLDTSFYDEKRTRLVINTTNFISLNLEKKWLTWPHDVRVCENLHC